MMGDVHRQAERGLLVFFVLLLAWAPLPLASNRPWGMAVLAASLCSLLALTQLLRAATFGRRMPEAEPGRWLAPALLGLLTLWVAWPLGPWGGTADAYATRLYLLCALAYAAGFLLVMLLVDTPKRRLGLLYGLLAAGVLQALLAIVLHSSGGKYNYLGTAFRQGFRATGTFASFDHLAHYMALTLSAGVGAMLIQLGRPQPAAANWQERLQRIIEFMMSGKMVLRLMLVLLVIAMVLTRSRAGNGAFFIAVLLLGAWVAVASVRLRRPALILVASLLVVDLIVIGQWVGLDKVVARMQATELTEKAKEQALEEARAAAAAVRAAASSAPAAMRPALPRPPMQQESLEERLKAAHDSLALIAAAPWKGHGGGSYYTVFPSVKGEDRNNRWDHAHNDYVEIAVDLGLPGLAMLAALYLATLWRVTRLLRDSQPPAVRGLAGGVAMGMICALLHGLVDFNLQVPANALTLTVLLALAWSVPLRTASAPPPALPPRAAPH